MLKLENVFVAYGHIQAVRGISLTVPDHSVVALLGANGAGKSTVLRAVSGLVKPREGNIWYKEERLTRLRPPRIAALGIIHCPEGRHVFTDLTVDENLIIGGYARRDKASLRRDRDWILGLFPALAARLRQRAGNLSGGEQQMLAIGRALMGAPQVLLLDEPSLGVSPRIAHLIAQVIGQIRSHGTAVLLVEQNSAIALSVADYAYVLQTGQIRLQGTAEELRHNKEVEASYLG